MSEERGTTAAISLGSDFFEQLLTNPAPLIPALQQMLMEGLDEP